ncbi:TAXI family TRAP transporter solute-binding subunit [Salinicoccus bachuensis]|uniref:TAXI family TRAP transporter solute-binding subunit n=1 Tax=Salinicoccus bachuensis TaxID=3136731 RepID=A0ABZ3CIG0_9STAP
MEFKKYLAVVLGCGLILSACGDGGGEGEGETETAEEGESSEGESSEGGSASLETNIVTIATGGSSGPYNIIATTLAEGYSSEFDVNSRTQTTGASAENLNLLGEEKVEMAFVMSDALTQAVNGEETFSEPIENVQQVAALYPNYVQVITTEGAGIDSIEDLAGKRVAVGDQNSGVEIATRSILEAHGMTYDDMEVDYLGYAEAAEAMRGGQIDAAFLTSGLPNASVMELQNSVDLKIVPIEGEAVDTLSEDAEYFESLEIPADTYGNEEAVPTAAIMNALVVREDLSEDDVYELTKYLFENLDSLSNAHQAAEDISLENAQDRAVIDIHPGAQRYYDEQ